MTPKYLANRPKYKADTFSNSDINVLQRGQQYHYHRLRQECNVQTQLQPLRETRCQNVCFISLQRVKSFQKTDVNVQETFCGSPAPFTFWQDVTDQGRILFSYSPAAFPKAHGLCPVADGITALYESSVHCSAHAQAVWPEGCVQSICHVVAWYCHVLWNQSAGFGLLQKLKECRIEQTVCKTLIMGFNDAVGSKVAECFLFTWPNSAVLQLHWN